jgi:hypothetical protein
VEASFTKIGQALRTYAESHAGQFPRRLDELQAAGLLEAADLKSQRGTAHVYGWNAGLRAPVPADYVLVHELGVGADGKRSVLFGDLRVESLEAARWGDVMRESSRARMAMLRNKAP